MTKINVKNFINKKQCEKYKNYLLNIILFLIWALWPETQCLWGSQSPQTPPQFPNTSPALTLTYSHP